MRWAILTSSQVSRTFSHEWRLTKQEIERFSSILDYQSDTTQLFHCHGARSESDGLIMITMSMLSLCLCSQLVGISL